MHIKIAHITTLQDARYCAAMGFQYINFCLSSFHQRSLQGQQIREITAWLSGTKYVLECDMASIPTLQNLHGTFPYHYIEIPQGDWKSFSFLPPVPFILQAHKNISFIDLESLIALVQRHHKDSKVEVNIRTNADYLKYEPLFRHLFLHVPSLEELATLLKGHKNKPWGISLREEALDTEGGLDYEKLDNLSEFIHSLG